MAEAKTTKGEMIFKKIISIMKEVGTIAKDQQNKQQGFQYRGVDDVYNELHQHLSKHGVFSVPEVLESRSEERETRSGGTLIYRILKMKYTFFAEDGSNIEVSVIGEGMDSGDKAANKAMAVAHKYALLQLFCIPTSDPKDPDAETHDLKGKGQQRRQNGQNGKKQKREKIPVEIIRNGRKLILDYYEVLNLFKIAKEKLGTEAYYAVLGNHGYEHSNLIRKADMDKVYQDLVLAFKDMQSDDPADPEFPADPEPPAEEEKKPPYHMEGGPGADDDIPF